MLNEETTYRLFNPGKIETMFINYLIAAKQPIGQSKTIASRSIYHQKQITGLEKINFFSGQYLATETNLEGSTFQRPLSEHFVITAVKFSIAQNGASVAANDVVYTDGISGNINIGVSSFKLQKATFSMEVNGIRYLKNVPLSESDALDDTDNQGIIQLNEPIIWPGNTNAEILVSSKPGQPFGDTGLGEFQFLRVELLGLALI